MIQSFRCKETENLFQGIRSRRLPGDIQRVAMRKLTYLNSVINLNALRVPPGNHLEALSGDREGQYSIRINDQWRICFEWRDDGPHQVEIVDYH
ncbi:MAG: type II toxin-antitoxin system RelE/ParE family toxin [Candidatus Tectomicrobia bacterium]|uniref:Type II toxin-antitoxin system RelE/ParE family toxin n=1 Tax=Tectimicrobiota bacterium TaxID=2528274 RepID=A0A932CMH7_UNCTE|nr:type II toxin-antitoxin system RelE/ParE family toxin [Candidatus Tectomicrobia bacterium]